MIVRLDFGGERRRARALRLSAERRPGTDVLTELGRRLPFRDNCVDEIFLDRALAHRDDFLGIMEECWRVSKPGTIVHLRLPHASSSWAISRDPQHSRHYSLETFNYFDPRFQDESCRSRATFRVEHARLYLAGPRRSANGLARARGAFSRIIEDFVNQNRGMQYRWERWFAPLFGGFEEFSVVLGVIKDPSLR